MPVFCVPWRTAAEPRGDDASRRWAVRFVGVCHV